MIPFVLFDIGDSMIKDVCRHQVALLNLISNDTNYAIEANFPILTRQRGNQNMGRHLEGDENDIEAGILKGLNYEKNMERPGFISPSTDPLRWSLELRRELKNEVHELVLGAITDLSEEGTLESGLAFIGQALLSGENRVWDHWTAYESVNPVNRKKPIAIYPDVWAVKPELERIEEAEKLAGTMYKVPGRKVKKEIAKLVADKLLRGRVTTKVMAEIHKEIDDAPYCTSDPEIIIQAKINGLMSTDTGALALGGTEDEAASAKKDQVERTAAIVTAQAAAGGAQRGNPDGSVDPKAEADGEKEMSQSQETRLDGKDGNLKRGADNFPREREDEE
jgi:hypothetical protein